MFRHQLLAPAKLIFLPCAKTKCLHFPARVHLSSLLVQHQLTRQSYPTNCSTRSITNAAMDSNSRQSYQYSSEALKSTHIRVLQIHDEDASLDSAGLIRCTLKTVDLDDMTEKWAALKSACNLHESTPDRSVVEWQKLYFSADCPTRDTDQPWLDLVKGSQNDSSVAATMRTIPPRYNWGDFLALSYVWGQPTPVQPILLNGCLFEVRASLYAALLRLRESPEVQKLGLHVWVDAICINQNDVEERAREVKKMAIIYSQCLTVRAWLGSPELQHSETSLALQHIRLQRTNKLSRSPSLGQGEDSWPLSADMVMADYWRRLWVLQEMCLAPSIVFYFGGQAFSSLNILNLGSAMMVAIMTQLRAHSMVNQGLDTIEIDSIQGNKPIPQLFGDLLLELNNMLERVSVLRMSRVEPDFRASFPDILYLARHSRVTDPRDKVYGFLGVLPPAVSEAIQPVYTPDFTFRNAVTMFVRAFLQVQREFDMFARVIRQPSDDNVRDLPSWASGLEDHGVEIDERRQRLRMGHGLKRYGANLSLPPTNLEFSTADGLMHCKGILIDEVATLGAYRSGTRPKRESNLAMSAVRNYDIEVGIPYIDAENQACEDWALALARVLVCDSNLDLSCPRYAILRLLGLKAETGELFCSNSQRGGINTLSSSSSTPDDCQNDTRREKEAWAISVFRELKMSRRLRDMLQCNGDFLVGGRPLRDHLLASLPSTYDEARDYAAKMDEFPRGSNINTFDGVGDVSLGTRLFTTKEGRLGVLPYFSKLGDKIAVLSMCDVPLVLRPVGEGTSYEIIGGCFVEGLMTGEAAEELKQGKAKLETLTIR